MKLKKRMTDGERAKYIFMIVGLSLVPVGYFLLNSSEILVKWRLKDRVRMRREWLDKEHGIDREEFEKTMREIDEVYRVNEKEEKEKLLKLGKVSDRSLAN